MICCFSYFFQKKNQGCASTPLHDANGLIFRRLEPYLCNFHNLFMNYYINSVTFSILLLKNKTQSTRTMRNNKKENFEEVNKITIEKISRMANKNQIYI